MKKIDFEAHFSVAGYENLESSTRLRQRGQPGRLSSAILDLGEGRLKAMDDTGIDMHILSLSQPQVQNLEPAEGTAVSREVNDVLAAAVKKYPDRFIGLATLAPQSPREAADELERCVTELGLKGGHIKSHARNEYLDAQKYWVIFERAEKLDVPIYIHPATPSAGMLQAYSGYGFVLSNAALGFAHEVSLHAMRLICSGLFDRYPKLQIVLGHMGEGLPYWLSRLDKHLGKERLKNIEGAPEFERKPSEYLRTNFTATTSGMFFEPALICACSALGADRVAFAVDYPYESGEEAVKFIESAKISDSDREKVCHLNAERLFKL